MAIRPAATEGLLLQLIINIYTQFPNKFQNYTDYMQLPCLLYFYTTIVDYLKDW